MFGRVPAYRRILSCNHDFVVGLASPRSCQLSLLRIPCARTVSTRVVENGVFNNSKAPNVDFGRRGGGAGDFVAGFLLGGAIGYLIAPTVKKTLAAVVEKEKDDVEDEGPPKKLPKYLEDDEGLEKTRKHLNKKTAQLNAAIDEVSSQLRADGGAFGAVNDSAVEESAA